MKKTLARELGIFSLISIACGAMVSGLLVLPGYAAGMTGPSVFLAFLLAGILFLPATFSKSEMATALPQAGGDYLFIDRSLGPFFSTISGLGMFFTLTMKSAFALAGFGAYLVIVMPLPDQFAQVAAILIAGFIIVVNYRGAKKSGTVQQVLFVITVLALSWFIAEGSLGVHDENLRPAMTGGWGGFFAATAFVFVSYAGVTKIASVAEEVKNPGKMIPIGMLVSLGIMVFLYVIVVYVMVGNVSYEQFLELKHFKDAPLALAGLEVAGPWGMYFIAGISALALIAMANAGVLASSRYPFALSRYKQLPDFLNRIHPTFSTPSVSILVTGVILVFSIAFLPVVQLAKLASAFKLIVLGMLNCALIILRESDIEWYQPDFRSPFYPYVQLVGIGSSLFLLCFLGLMTLFASAGLIVFAAGWYYFYVRNRVDRKGAIFQSAKIDAKDLELFNRARSSQEAKESVIVPFFELGKTDPVEIERRMRLAASLCAEDERLDVVDFVEIAEQSLLSEFETDQSEFDILEERSRLLKNEFDNEIQIDQVITHNSRGALLNYARQENPHWVVFDWKKPSPWQILIGNTKWWLEDLPCDAFFFQDNGINSFQKLLVAIEPGPYDGEVIYAADKISSHFGGRVTFLTPVDESDEEQVDFIESYQKELTEILGKPATTEAISESSWEEELIERSHSVDLMLIGGRADDSFFNRDELVGESTRRELQCNYARIRSNLKSPRSILKSDQEPGMDLYQFLQESGSLLRLEPTDKSALFKNIAESFTLDGIETSDVEDALWERENMQDTYIDDGIAFPHGILEGVQETRVRFVALKDPVNYTSRDDHVSFCVVTLGPPDDRDNHLQILRRLSDVFLQSEAKDHLQTAEDYDEVLKIISRYL